MTIRSATTGILMRLGSSTLILSAAFAAAVLPVPPAALAHHSFAMFDATQTLTTPATVKEFQ
jgi:3-dehydroquinate dehydratase